MTFREPPSDPRKWKSSEMMFEFSRGAACGKSANKQTHVDGTCRTAWGQKSSLQFLAWLVTWRRMQRIRIHALALGYDWNVLQICQGCWVFWTSVVTSFAFVSASVVVRIPRRMASLAVIFGWSVNGFVHSFAHSIITAWCVLHIGRIWNCQFASLFAFHIFHVRNLFDPPTAQDLDK